MQEKLIFFDLDAITVWFFNPDYFEEIKIMVSRLKITDLSDSKIIIPDDLLFLIVKSVQIKTGRNGSKFIDLELNDGYTSVGGKVWNVTEESESLFKQNSLIKVMNGKSSLYQGSLQLVIEEASPMTQEEIDSYPGLIPESKYSLNELVEKWNNLKELLDEEHKIVVDAFMANSRYWNLFTVIPAGKSMHHAYRRGLLEHTVSVADIVYAMSDKYNRDYKIDVSLALLGAMLHDAGKVFEFSVNDYTMLVDRYSDRGKLLGHIYMGATYIEKLLYDVIPDKSELRMELLHIMLSHHGEYEYGSPKIPKTPEAFLVAAADNLDAHINGIYGADMNGNEENWTGKIFALQRSFFMKDRK